ncbi:hypothetical protein [Pseudomonas sp. dw_358]|uniref:hypothetical protein n=1 Tax=Pseudomonas sp. dw_358 TaxID=2720083 RepID=UPI001BD4AD47|nr:hypothetical protein [Pseudomonas sp. dw_358]
MSDRTYPYTAWLLTRNFQPLEIELVAPGYGTSTRERTQSGRNYELSELFASREAAIACGEERLALLSAELAKRQASLDKRRVALLRHKQAWSDGVSG